MKRKKKSFINAAAVLLLFILSWPACTHKKNDSNTNNILRIGTIQRVKSKNILFDHVLDTFTMVSHPPLLTLNNNGEINGLLGERYTVSEDFTRWTFYIRDNYFWSDGVPVTAEDVKFSIEYIGSHVPSRRWLKRAMARAEVLSVNAVALTFNQPYTRLDIEFTSFPIIPRHIWHKVDRPRFYSGQGKYIGCGPLVIQRIDLNAGLLLLEKNAYWKGFSPVIDRVEIHMYQNLDVLSLALERGDIDTYYKYADTYPYANVQRLKATGRFSFKKNKTTGLTFLGFNLQRDPGANLYFRQAVALAVDYEEILKLITSGYGELPNQGFVPSGMLYYEAFPKLKQNLKTAKALLANAGFKDSNRDGILENPQGEVVPLILLSTPAFNRLCELIAEYLGHLGLEVEVKIVESATWISMKEEYDYDITITRTTPWGMLMHAGWGTGYFDSRRTGEGVLHTVSDPTFLTLCDSILSERDPDKLKAYAHSLQQYYSQNLPAVALIQHVIVTPYNKAFTGWHQVPLFGIFNITNFLNLKHTHELQ
jgi:peptide/nickel transport system substrate-binding protein